MIADAVPCSKVVSKAVAFAAFALAGCESPEPPDRGAPVAAAASGPSGIMAQSPDREEPFEFGRVLGGGLLADGGFFAIDAFEPAVHRFGSDATWQARAIGPGAGPGELQYPVELGFGAHGGWLLWDGELRRALEMDSTLAIVDHIAPEHSGTRIIGRMPDGREIQVRSMAQAPGDPPGHGPVLLMLRGREAASDSVIGRLHVAINETDGAGQSRRILLAPEFLWATTPQGVLVAHTHENEVRWLRPGDGDMAVMSSLGEGAGATVSDAQKEAVRQAAVEEFRRQQSDPEGLLAHFFVRVVENARVEDVWPTFDALVGAGDGRAWVRRPPRPGDPCAQWEAIAPGGERTRYDLPRFTWVMDSRGDRILLLSRGQFDEHIVSVASASAPPTCVD